MAVSNSNVQQATTLEDHLLRSHTCWDNIGDTAAIKPLAEPGWPMADKERPERRLQLLIES